MAAETVPKTHKFKAEVNQVLSLVINSLYSNKEIFLRELVSNASDALDKLRFEGISQPKLVPNDHQPRIRLTPDEANRTLTLEDNGIGMSQSALAKDLGTVARSGSREFLDKLNEAKSAEELQLIGQFGVGFYSGYLVADRIDVISRAAGSKKAHRWSSDGQETFTVEPAERDQPGTTVVLHLSEEHADYAKSWKLRELVSRYSDFISYPIELAVESKPEDGEGEAKLSYEAINQASALWTRDKKDISPEQYEEFYKHLSHDFEGPATHIHFKVEGTQMFKGLLYIPKRPPFDLTDPEVRHGVRLYVRRVFIMDNCEELVPKWLRFVRGVIDSDDLPLNVSRELLQDSAQVRAIRKQVVRRVLEALKKLAEDDDAAYQELWLRFGSVIKEGLHYDAGHKDDIAPLLRYGTSRSEELTSLAAYVERMPEGQTQIYYALGPNRRMLDDSPHLERLKKQDFEVLYMTDGVDQWAVEGMDEYQGKPLASAMDADLEIESSDAEEKKDDSEDADGLQGLLTHCQGILEEQVSEVRASSRLTDSPACLVLPKGGLPAHLERLIRSYQRDLPDQKRILELNPKHPLIGKLRTLHGSDAESDKLKEWVELLYDQALVAEGSPLPDPGRFARRMTALLEAAAE